MQQSSLAPRSWVHNRVAVMLLATSVHAPAFAAEHWTERTASRARVPMPSLAPLVKEAEASVLSIYVESRSGVDPNDPRLDFFRRFGVEVPDFKQQGQGTGFLIHPDGYAITNHHVIEGATKIKVRVGGAPELITATVVGDDPRTDVALIKLEGNRKWPAIPLGDSTALQVGDFVIAIGNPFGLSQSVSTGIISAKSRRDVAPSGRQGLYDFIQTDASINPGNSGGPLVNMDGEVVGINSAINAAAQGIGFAIPINMVKAAIPDLKKNGHVERGWMGVGIRRVDPNIAKGLGLDRPRGALVSQVSANGPAFKAGLKPGDVITKFDGTLIEDSSDLPLLAAGAGVGKTVPIELVRDGEARSGKLVLAALPKDDSDTPAAAVAAEEQNPGRIGVRVDTLDDNMRRRIDVGSDKRGVVIVGVEPGGAAADAGLEPGDLVTDVNGKAVVDANGFVKAVGAVKSGGLLKLIVIKKGATTFIALAKP